jgi:D-psicose/D-tagatose/L-ribulose 3-epimerase
MRFGVNAFLWTANFTAADLPLLEKAASWGYDGIELFISDPASFAIRDIRQGIEENGLGLTVCAVASPETNPISPDPAIRARALLYFQDSIRAVADAGGEILGGPVYAPLGVFTGRRRESEEWRRAVEFLAELGPTLVENRITLAVEPLNRFETYFLNTQADAVALVEQVNHPRIGILFDTFHANIEEKSIAAALRQAGPWVKHLHANENDRGTPGSGHVDWDGLFEAIRAIGYRGWMTIESFGSAIPEIAGAARIWRDLERDSETLAVDGLQFLRSRTRQSKSASDAA